MEYATKKQPIQTYTKIVLATVQESEVNEMKTRPTCLFNSYDFLHVLFDWISNIRKFHINFAYHLCLGKYRIRYWHSNICSI